MAPYLFHQGTNFHAADYLGAHPTPDGFVFRVWAPNAAAAFVVGDFADWENGIPMTRITSGGIWEATAPGAPSTQAYKFLIVTGDGRRLYKADPYARLMECPPATASCLYCSDYV
jgi:1,4-alpha-glucan branching enzyme